MGSARALALARVSEEHTAYRWLRGGAPVNHNLLSEFRCAHGEALDRLLTRGLAALLAEGLVEMAEVAIGGTKLRAAAGGGSLAGRRRLAGLQARVVARIAALKQELDAILRGASEAARQGGSRQAGATRSTTDPQARAMRLPDGATCPAWNLQVATANGFVLAIEPIDRRNDSGLAQGLMRQVHARCARLPERLLGDSGSITQRDIVQFAERYPQLVLYTPTPPDQPNASAESVRKRRWLGAREPEPIQAWRHRMASEAGQQVYRRRKQIERAHAHMKNRGLRRLLVRGLAKVRAVALIHAIAHNLWRAHRLRQAAA